MSLSVCVVCCLLSCYFVKVLLSIPSFRNLLKTEKFIGKGMTDSTHGDWTLDIHRALHEIYCGNASIHPWHFIKQIYFSENQYVSKRSDARIIQQQDSFVSPRLVFTLKSVMSLFLS